jgi:hypothetical protein
MLPNARYYIRKNSEAYFEVYPSVRPEVKKELYSGEKFYRYSFNGSFEFRNYEKSMYRTASNQTLFDTLLNYTRARDFDRYKDRYKIKIDYNDSELVVEGYFGVLDYSVNNDDIGKVITINPAIDDLYTDLIANLDKKVDVLNGANMNKLGNGDFELWDNDNEPTGWTLNNLCDVERYYYLGSNKAKLISQSPLDLLQQSMYKIISGVTIGSVVSINFDYLLSLSNDGDNPYNDRFTRYFKLYLGSYTLNQEGKWILSSGEKYDFATSELPLGPSDLSSISSMNSISINTEPTPIAGSLLIQFYNGNDGGSFPSMFNVNTILDNIIVRANTMATKTIKAKIYDSYLQLIPVFIDDSEWTLRCTPRKTKYDDAGGIAMYFDGSGAPTNNLLSNITFAPNHNQTGKYLSDWVQIFEDAASATYTKNYYQCQLAEITVYECGTEWWGLKQMKPIYATATFARDYATTTVDAPPQADAGWVKTGYLNDRGEYEWVRKPFNTESTEWILGDIEIDGSPNDLGTFQGKHVAKKLTSKRNYPTTTGEDTELINCVELRDIIKTVFNQTHQSYADKNVYSHFLWNDYPSEYTTFDSVLNYATGKPNILNRIACQHTFELKQLNSTDPITEQDLKDSTLELSFNDLMNNLKAYFKTNNIGHLYWFLTTNGDLRIEHSSYFYISGTSVSSEPDDEDFNPVPVIQNYDQYKYLLDEMPSRITVSQINAGYKDFVDNKMTFDTITSGTRDKELKIENKIDYFSTDLRYCIENKDSLDNGLILINYENAGSDYIAAYGQCQLQGNSFLNGNLALSSILKNYCTYEGTFINGYINSEQVNFVETVFSKEGIEITIKGIVDESFIRTKLGTGLVISCTFDFERLTTTVLLRYSSRAYIDAGIGKVLDLGFYI